MGYYFDFGAGTVGNNTNLINALVQYVNEGGVFILMSQNPNCDDFLQAYYGAGVSANVDSPYKWVYPILSNVDDMITNGPFGDIRGKYWGGDCGDVRIVSGLPNDQLIYYSYPSSQSSHVFFRDRTKGFLFNGEGGFLANSSGCTGDPCGGATMETYPFAIDANLKPRINWGQSGNNPPRQTVYNSALFGNIMAWALEYAEAQGVNSLKNAAKTAEN